MSIHTTADVSYTGVQPNNKITLTPEELAVLKECNAEGFSKRGVPCGLVFAVGSFYALKRGVIKPHPRFGVLPAITISGVIGCITGSLSYKSVCVQRVLALPNGTLRQQIEAMQHGAAAVRGPSTAADFPPEKYEFDLQGPMVSGSQMDIYQSNNNFDGFTGVNSDGDQLSNYDTTKPLPQYTPGVTTYDDLRQRNREEYARSTAPRQNLPPSRGAPQGPLDYPPLSRPSGPIFEDSRPFDRDRVPQYHLD